MKSKSLIFMGTFLATALFMRCGKPSDTIGVHDNPASCQNEWDDNDRDGDCRVMTLPGQTQPHYIFIPRGGGYYGGNYYDSYESFHRSAITPSSPGKPSSGTGIISGNRSNYSSSGSGSTRGGFGTISGGKSSGS